MVEVAMVTIKREEFDALLARFPLEVEAPEHLAAKYKFRRVSSNGQWRTVAITRCVMQGTGDAQTVTQNVITDLQPALVLIVGIAGMPPSSDLFLGDIVLATHVHDFNLAAETQNGQEFAESGASPPYWLTRFVCNLDFGSPALNDWHSDLGERPTISEAVLEFTSPAETDWNNRIRECVKCHSTRQVPKVADGPIASSDDLLKNPESVRKRLSVDRRIVAVEMESAGAARACNNVGRGESPVPFLPIRAISDIVGLKRSPEWEAYACRAAALFASKFVEYIPVNLLARTHSLSRGDEVVRVVACLTAATGKPLPSTIFDTVGIGELGSTLQEEMAAGRLKLYKEGLVVADGFAPHDLPESATFLTPLLESLLRYIAEHAEEEKGIDQVKGAVVLARTVLVQAPYLAHPVYDTLDHPMKGIGDKSLVREVSQMCIDAASKRQHDRDAAECIARARICGLSWVHQRTNQLDLAQDEAKKSLDLGRKLGYAKNDAFCLKCLGRLQRMRAEQASNDADRKRFLRDSVVSLRDAIKLFEELPEFGPDHPQVGDCFSLLGRTYLVSGVLGEAAKAAKEAQKRIIDDASKAYFDLQILLGDLALKTGRDSPIPYYSTVIKKHIVGKTDDYELCEIVARASQ